jgi:hypothetical protein
LGSVVLEVFGESKIGMTEVFSRREYRNSLAHGSDFLDAIRDELHPLYDPDRVLIDPGTVETDE